MVPSERHQSGHLGPAASTALAIVLSNCPVWVNPVVLRNAESETKLCNSTILIVILWSLTYLAYHRIVTVTKEMIEMTKNL